MSKRHPTQTRLSAWQKEVRAQFHAIAAAHPDAITIRGCRPPSEDGLLVDVTLDTSTLSGEAREPGGLRLNTTEDFTIAIRANSLVQPLVFVTHDRFLGFPHVLAGQTLCLYLDPSREWQPLAGMSGLLERLWGWLDDAVRARFDPGTALYHAVGGVPHVTGGTPFIVVRHSIDEKRRVQSGHLRQRTANRYDHHPGPSTRADEIPAPIFLAPFDMPFGAGRDWLTDLLLRLDLAEHQRRYSEAFAKPAAQHHFQLARPDLTSTAIATHRRCPQLPGYHVRFSPRLPSPAPAPPTASTALLTTLAASAARQADGSEQYLLLGVPHPEGGPPHLLGLRLPSAVGDAIRRSVRARETPILNLERSDVYPEIDMEWCYVSDEREAVTRRRDETRPVGAIAGTTVHVWGCGGLGSWIAEFVVRAGARRVVLCDPSVVTGGLLVRQNYTESDVGCAKVKGLADRLRAISDWVEIEIGEDRMMLPADWDNAATNADLIIDATISNAVGHCIDLLAKAPDRRATIAKVATDTRTGTLGLAVVAAADKPVAVSDIDNAAGATVMHAHDLESYSIFWSEPGAGDELTPTRGCSAPTFHGSAADLAGIAGALISLIGVTMHAGSTGTHLIALPHSGVTPAHRYLPHV